MYLMPFGWGRTSAAGVIVVDDDPTWQRALRRSLRDLDVKRIYSATSRDDLESLIIDLEPCVVLSELALERGSLAGLGVIDLAHAFAAPAALVAGCTPGRLRPLREARFLRKTAVGRTTLRHLLRELEAGLPPSCKLLPSER